MPTVLRLRRTLECRPTLPIVPGMRLRHFAGPDDIEVWLDLRRRSFAGEPIGVRAWTRADFEAEFLAKPWWSHDRLWFARSEEAGGLISGQLLGTIALAQRGELPVIHWLGVLSECRRRGIGRLLLSALEARCWDSGARVVALETHAKWEAAVRFYAAQGYRL